VKEKGTNDFQSVMEGVNNNHPHLVVNEHKQVVQFLETHAN